MPTTSFEPKFMKVGVLTAALQELTPRDVRDPDPDRAIEEWWRSPRTRRRLHPAVGGAAPHRDRRARPRRCSTRSRTRSTCAQPFDKARAQRVQAALKATGVGISDIAYFDNMLHDDPAVRKKKHDFMLRVFDAAVLLGVNAVCGFVGRNQQRSMDQNLIDFEQHFIPLLKARRRAA